MLIRLEKLNVVKYCNNPVKIAALKEDGYTVVEGIEPEGMKVKENCDTKKIIDDTIDDLQENEIVNYKYDGITIEEIKKILDEKGIEYDNKAKKEVLFALLV